MFLMEETLYLNNEWLILDADCRKTDVIVLLKGKGENIVQLNGDTILAVPTGHHKIRFTKEHFCLLEASTLSFYSLAGELVSEYEIGNDVYELFPYRQGVLCIYGDEGAFGYKLGKNLLNYSAPMHQPESLYDIAVQNHLLYEALFARFKPYACLSWQSNKLHFLNGRLEKEKTVEIPFDSGNTFAFALTYEFGVFIERHKMRLWDFEGTGNVSEFSGEFTYKTRAIYNRHEFLFLTVSDHEVRVFKPIVNKY